MSPVGGPGAFTGPRHKLSVRTVFPAAWWLGRGSIGHPERPVDRPEPPVVALDAMRSPGFVVARPVLLLLLLASGACASAPAPDSAAKPPPAEPPQQAAQAPEAEQAPEEDEEPVPQQPACEELVGWAQPAERCEREEVAGGKASIVSITEACGGDSCSVQVFIHRPGQPAVRLPDAINEGSLTGGTLVVTPSLEHVITDWVGPGPRQGDWRVELYRVELKTGKASPWVKGCFSPALSPGGRWVLCRNRRGDVLKVPLTGGTPRLVHRSGLSEDRVYWVPYGYIYPDAVSFLSPERMKVTTTLQGGEEEHTRELPWKE